MWALSWGAWPLAATTYYVATNGSDTQNNGTSTNTPWKTFYHANNTVNAGDTVFIRGGTYR